MRLLIKRDLQDLNNNQEVQIDDAAFSDGPKSMNQIRDKRVQLGQKVVKKSQIKSQI